ncbi:TRNA_splicing endonuclease [Hexamita inflata]|uniref:tRNA-intron lyase n=1 Tax=Hexamita inflata TaxID=28002 RepID=A0AA86TB29_9EUKA|nr:TRNA splicing endonuclease [Hexamita inflata]CAI9913989.1 TRNA splicing endonuclease [Hexamita inflata]CAI9952260.1 TRNA splicing endonuclease [Hexamita inflata]CAI9964326.1 TRNA splicing endonuclease [Hexamita inflata]
MTLIIQQIQEDITTNHGRALWNFGIGKCKGTKGFDATLPYTINKVELNYLLTIYQDKVAYTDVVLIQPEKQLEQVTDITCILTNAHKDAESLEDRFFMYFRQRNLYPRLGLHFGCTFLVYNCPNVEEDHALYMFQIRSPQTSNTEIISMLRICKTVKKQLLLGQFEGGKCEVKSVQQL